MARACFEQPEVGSTIRVIAYKGETREGKEGKRGQCAGYAPQAVDLCHSQA
jgi:hypothetical protein